MSDCNTEPTDQCVDSMPTERESKNDLQFDPSLHVQTRLAIAAGLRRQRDNDWDQDQNRHGRNVPVTADGWTYLDAYGENTNEKRQIKTRHEESTKGGRDRSSPKLIGVKVDLGGCWEKSTDLESLLCARFGVRNVAAGV